MVQFLFKSIFKIYSPQSKSSSSEVVPADQHRLADQDRDDLTWGRVDHFRKSAGTS